MRRWKSVSTNLATLSARLSSTVAIFVINGLAARHMTKEQYGLWTILYLINLFTNGLDMGFQFTLGNRMAALSALGPEAETERRETFLSVFFLQILFYIVDILLVLLIVPHIPWVRWLKIKDPQLGALAVRQMVPFLVLMIGTLPINLVWTVFFAYREIQRASLLTGICNLLQVGVFFTATCFLNFTGMVYSYFWVNIGLGVSLTIYLLVHRHWAFTLPLPGRMLAIIRSLSRVSFHAFFHNISAVITTILGPLISGAVSGLAAAGDFSNIQKLFSFLMTAHLALMAPVSPEITANSHAGNWEPVRRRLRQYIFIVWPAFFLGLGGVIWVSHPLLIRVWLGYHIQLYWLAGMLLVWACISGFTNTYSVFLNSLGLMKAQAAFSLAMVLPNILIPTILGRWWGPVGIVYGFILCSIPSAIILPLYTYNAIRRQKLRV